MTEQLIVDRRPLASPLAARLGRLAASAPDGAIDALERVANGRPMFFECDCAASRLEYRQKIVGFLHAQQLVRRGPLVTLSGRDLLNFMQRNGGK